MPDALLGFLKLCLLALLYLFFARVLWAVWNEVRAARAAEPAAALADDARTPKSRRRDWAKPPEQLVARDPVELRGRSYPIGAELTIGRASGCAIRLPDDGFVSQLHARIYTRGGDVWVEDLGSTNGTALNGMRLAAAVRLHRGDRLRIGSTLLEAA